MGGVIQPLEMNVRQISAGAIHNRLDFLHSTNPRIAVTSSANAKLTRARKAIATESHPGAMKIYSVNKKKRMPSATTRRYALRMSDPLMSSAK
jgi:hypothetical protein